MLLREGPLDSRRAARYAAQIARAVHVAHVEGILHRDLKPQNVLIDKPSDRALVADFGLAKLMENSSKLTRYGEIMGTPQYMSPEQAQDAASVTVATDVYSIGATLYHLLTGRPPFHAANAVETLAQVVMDEPVAPRRLNREIDRDLETICLKCLEKPVERRYSTAADVADELDRYLTGQPIQARPLGLIGHVAKWCRRRPLPAALSACSLLLLIVTLIAVGVGYVRTSQAWRSSQAGFRDALAALDHVVERLRDEPLVNEPRVRRLREDLLREALNYYESFLSKRANDPALRNEVAQAYLQIGLIREEIMSGANAAQSLGRAVDAFRRLAARSPRDPRPLAALGTAVNAMGRVHARHRDIDRAQESFAEAVSIRRRLVELAGDSEQRSEYQRMLVNSHMNLGILERRRGRFHEARSHFETAQRTRRQLMRESPFDDRLQRDLGIGFYNLGQLELAAQQDATAREHFQSAVDNLEVFNKPGAEPTARYPLAVSLRLLADLEDDVDAAAERYQSALQVTQPLVDEFPDVQSYVAELAELEMNRGQLEADAERDDQAAEAWRHAESLLEQLRRADPDAVAHLRNLAIVYRELGGLALARQQPGQVHQYLDRAVELFTELVEKTKDDADRELLNEARDARPLTRSGNAEAAK